MELKLQKNKKGEVVGAFITGVPLYYTRIRKPAATYKDQDVAYDKAEKEYKTTFAVSEEIADEWDEIFTKQTSNKVPNAKFIEMYNKDGDKTLPLPDEKKQFTLKVAQKELKADGTPSTSPKVFEMVDGKAVEITHEKNVGNGSLGAVKVRAVSNKYGTFAYLDTVRVDDLVEYEGNEGGVDTEFLGTDDVEVDDRKHTTATNAPIDGDDPEEDPFADTDDDDSDDY